MTIKPHTHGADELCEAGSTLYAQALTQGRIRREEAEAAPCLIDFGLMHPEIDDIRWLRPTPPAIALPRLLRTIEDDIARQRQREEQLATAFEPLMTLAAGQTATQATASPAITMLMGLPRINAAVDQAAAAASKEVLAIQPGGIRPPELMAESLKREQALLSRGCRMRTLYQHTTRHSLPALAHYEQLQGDVEVRTLDEVTERLFLFDRTVAFIPGGRESAMAVEVRHPDLVGYLAITFVRFWRLATPMFPQAAPQPSDHGITTRQRAIASLLIEGLTDTEIATRLGMNVRTARVHIAKLAATLGSESRAQLGYLIGQSGILDPEV